MYFSFTFDFEIFPKKREYLGFMQVTFLENLETYWELVSDDSNIHKILSEGLGSDDPILSLGKGKLVDADLTLIFEKDQTFNFEVFKNGKKYILKDGDFESVLFTKKQIKVEQIVNPQ